MTTPTWGISIPGYSYPSPWAKAKFERMFPGAAARHREESEARKKVQDAEQAERVRKEREITAACTHTFVSTNLNGGMVCKKCRHWTDNPAVVFADLA